MYNLTKDLRRNGLDENQIRRIRRWLNGNGWSCKDVIGTDFRTFNIIRFASRFDIVVEYVL